jgi:5'-nucleotidase
MAYDLEDRLVIGVASSAVFDLQESDGVFREQGEQKYRKFQRENLNNPLKKGIAFQFIRRLLSLNALSQGEHSRLVEVILLSRNDPDTGLRVMKTIQYYDLDITRAIFTQGKSPYDFIPALNISLFLSANQQDVLAANNLGFPAGQVLESQSELDEADNSLRIAFDFDGVLAGDKSEQVMQESGLEKFHQNETKKVNETHEPGPLQKFLLGLSNIQAHEEKYKLENPQYSNKIRISLVTARNAPSHERALNTLLNWNVMVNDAFFLGGIEKGRILSVLKPHIFFDDQIRHLESASKSVPSVHIPFGITNKSLNSPPISEVDK